MTDNNIHEAETGEGNAETVHVVSAGETLIAIAKRHGLTLKTLLDSNPQITDANRIRVGQRLTIPAGHLAVASPSPVSVVAVAGGGAPAPATSSPVVVNIDSPAFAAMDKRGKTGSLHPVFRERLALLAEMLSHRGMKALITDGLRTFEEQDKLFEIGRRGIPGEEIVTKARGGESNHNYGLAVDMYPVLPNAAGRDSVFTSIPGDASVEFARAFRRIQNAIGEDAEAIGLFWGARFTGIVDTPHIQLLAEHDMSARECLKIFRDNGNRRDAVWAEATRRVKPLTA